ncbi:MULTISPECIES: biopolymer transporter ExbD [unclassified Leptolyngbya]|uniref:ExbD/TolR family protein n=1 Tax=unclassified Leptolyngbya TaxID=2650499 RepID=UPI0016894E46|nr:MULTISPECIES: biopolymer transporter ExbD [unclassified Leptolyngbya]MBD1910961.1 biopolymer transporter ExbD [Leptolyngbya sp. FACHB-8]MBD2158372.1 biopolymer transporter ExbD [Leptolyngbya sp. FACHB-16]
MRLPSEPEPPSQINIVPMIDVIFAILTFFIMSSLYLTRSAGLPVNLPGAATSEEQNQTQLVVSITSDGGLALDQEPMDLSTLAGRVQQAIANNPTPPIVVINADKAVSHGAVVGVMDQLRQIPGVRLAIATQRQ